MDNKENQTDYIEDITETTELAQTDAKSNIKDLLSKKVTFGDIKNFFSTVKKSADSFHDKLKFINTFWLKIIAIVTMTIDHAGIAFGLTYNSTFGGHFLSGTLSLERYELLRSIGRIAFPIFCYLIVEGLFHTRNVIKYCIRLFVFALASQVPFSLLLYGKPYVINGGLNVYFTLFLGLVTITVLDFSVKQYKSEEIPTIFTFVPPIILAFGTMYIAEFLRTDYDSVGIMFILLFYIFRKHPILLCLGLYAVIYNFSNDMELYALWALIPILLHNGKKGPGLKYFFYLYYPLHMLLLFLLNQYAI